eukprot:Skav202386  [mRNA]  locus=scaffold1406:363609:366142:- [translate_table: standard]
MCIILPFFGRISCGPSSSPHAMPCHAMTTSHDHQPPRLGGALRSHQHSRSDLDEVRDRPTAQPTLWDPSSWGASPAQSPVKGSMKGSESPLTVVAAEDMPGSIGSPGARSPPAKREREVPPDPEAPMLHQILEQLYTSLKAWETSVKSNTSLTGHFLPDRDYRQEERAVNVASIAFEEFHAKLGHLAARPGRCKHLGFPAWDRKGQKSFMQRLGASMSQDDGQKAIVRGNELLRALEGLSPWADAKKIQDQPWGERRCHRPTVTFKEMALVIGCHGPGRPTTGNPQFLRQELLQLRQEYFLDVKWDPERSRFSCDSARWGLRCEVSELTWQRRRLLRHWLMHSLIAKSAHG